MTFKEYLKEVFEHTEKTAKTETLKNTLHRDYIKQKDALIMDQGLTPDEAEDTVLETLPTPDEQRDKLSLEPNLISGSDKFFSFFRWITKALIVLLIILYLNALDSSTGFFFDFGFGWTLRQSALLFYYIGWSLVLNAFAILFLMNRPESSYGEKVRKHSLIIIGLITHPIGLPTLVIGLMYKYSRMQKSDYLRKRLVNVFKTKKNPIAVYGGTFIIFLVLILGGFTLASGLFTDQDTDPMTVKILFENAEGDRLYQKGNIKLVSIDEDTTRIEPYINQYPFETTTLTDLNNAHLSYSINGVEGVRKPIRFDRTFIVENSIVINQGIETVIDTFEISITVTYEENGSGTMEREFLIDESNISNIIYSDNEDTYWIFD